MSMNFNANAANWVNCLCKVIIFQSSGHVEFLPSKILASTWTKKRSDNNICNRITFKPFQKNVAVTSSIFFWQLYEFRMEWMNGEVRLSVTFYDGFKEVTKIDFWF